MYPFAARTALRRRQKHRAWALRLCGAAVLCLAAGLILRDTVFRGGQPEAKKLYISYLIPFHITEKADFLFSLIYHKPLGQYAVYDHIHPWLKNIIIGADFHPYFCCFYIQFNSGSGPK